MREGVNASGGGEVRRQSGGEYGFEHRDGGHERWCNEKSFASGVAQRDDRPPPHFAAGARSGRHGIKWR